MINNDPNKASKNLSTSPLANKAFLKALAQHSATHTIQSVLPDSLPADQHGYVLR